MAQRTELPLSRSGYLADRLVLKQRVLVDPLPVPLAYSLFFYRTV